jgi:hypothetical protein
MLSQIFKNISLFFLALLRLCEIFLPQRTTEFRENRRGFPVAALRENKNV